MVHIEREYSVVHVQISGVSFSDFVVLEALVGSEAGIAESGWGVFLAQNDDGFGFHIDPFCHGISQELHDILTEIFDGGKTNVDILEFYIED